MASPGENNLTEELNYSHEQVSLSQPATDRPTEGRRGHKRTVSEGLNNSKLFKDSNGSPKPVDLGRPANNRANNSNGRPNGTSNGQPRITMAVLHADIRKLDESMCSIKDSLLEEMSKLISETVAATVQKELAKFKRTFDTKCKQMDDRIHTVESNSANIGERFETIEDNYTVMAASMDEQLNAINAWQDDDSRRISELYDKVDVLSSRPDRPNNLVDDISKNIVLRNVAESAGEDVLNKVKRVLSEGLGMNRVKLSAAKRLQSHFATDGLIIATCDNIEDKVAILRKKSELAHSKQFSKVIIHSDKSKLERKVESKLRAMDKVLQENNLHRRNVNPVRTRKDQPTRDGSRPTPKADEGGNQNRNGSSTRGRLPLRGGRGGGPRQGRARMNNSTPSRQDRDY